MVQVTAEALRDSSAPNLLAKASLEWLMGGSAAGVMGQKENTGQDEICAQGLPFLPYFFALCSNP